MANVRKHVTLYGRNDGFKHALAALLTDMTVSLEERPSYDRNTADVVVWDCDERTSTADLARVAVSVPTLVVSDQARLLDAVDAGARGFLPRGTPLDEMRKAVQTIMSGGAVVPPELLGTLLRHIVKQRRQTDEMTEQLHSLTERELQVFELAATGARKDEIGERLFISSATARTHLQRVYRKLGIHSQAELIALRNTMEAQPEVVDQ